MAVHRIDVVYKIRNKDGQWSRGGTNPSFNTIGKVWSRLSDVKLHIKDVISYRKNWDTAKNAYRECDLVYFTESPSDTHSMESFIGEMEEKE